ncbi:DNA cytosine methyltransferase [Methylotenera sp. G11]|uniref:DNA cytosine methyltransferase n=1 Tax=Methylotenera sp. G11 TaxID=1506585 RepID=UPI0006485B88|nr:DNA cytosine methyltransferase [Methylotenera sp. G11]
MANKYKIVDLFSGCGGFGLGAKQAGFDVVAAVDIDKTLQSSYQLNFPQTRTLNGDLSIMDEDSWRIILDHNEIDGVIGGPPCQGYSRIGKNERDDPRRSLLMHFYRTVNIILPKFFIMENVEGLLDEGNVEELNKAIETVDKRYTVLPPTVVDASSFGVPTKRKRVVVIGYDSTRMNQVFPNDLIPTEIPLITVRDAILDLPDPLRQNSEDYGWAPYNNAVPSNYAKRMRSAPPAGMGWNVALGQLKVGNTSGHFETVHTEAVRLRYLATRPGATDKISRSKKLEWDGLCPTLRAGTGADKGSYQAVRPLHPEQGRVITVREAARLQGFPDWFCFHKTKWHSFRMIGNSVSPVVAQSLLSLVKSKLDQENPIRQVIS